MGSEMCIRDSPIIQGTHPLDRAADAHREMEESQHIGKILLTVSG